MNQESERVEFDEVTFRKLMARESRRFRTVQASLNSFGIKTQEDYEELFPVLELYAKLLVLPLNIQRNTPEAAAELSGILTQYREHKRTVYHGWVCIEPEEVLITPSNRAFLLQPRLFRTIKPLVSACGTPLSIDEIINQGFLHKNYNRNSIQRNIETLRSIIDIPDKDRIVTLKNVGYVLK